MSETGSEVFVVLLSGISEGIRSKFKSLRCKYSIFAEKLLRKMVNKDVNMEEWQRKRKWIFINLCIGALAYGLSLNIYFPTEYYYLKYTVKVENPDLYFGLAQASLFLSGVVCSIIGSYYADYTKNIREICLFEDVLNVIGNIMYTLYYSPYLIFFGQLLIGTTSARMTSTVGEISRVYGSDKITQKLGILGLIAVLGTLVGPCTTFIFQYVDICIGNWKWNIGNMVGISMTAFYLFQFTFNYFTLHNVSKEYTWKKEFFVKPAIESSGIGYADETTPLRKSGDDELSFKHKYIISLKVLFGNKHIFFCLAMVILQNYARGLVKIVTPIKGDEYLSWKQIDIAKLWVISSAIGSIPSMILINILTKYVNDFFLYLSTFIVTILCLLLMGLLPMLKHDVKNVEIIFYCVATLYLMSNGTFHILPRAILAKFVPENIQSLAEGFRNALFELAVFISGLSVTLPATYLPQTMFAMAVVIAVSLAWYISEKRIYRNIKVIDVNYKDISAVCVDETTA